jgi:two-component system, OmpR family, response regulator
VSRNLSDIAKCRGYAKPSREIPDNAGRYFGCGAREIVQVARWIFHRENIQSGVLSQPQAHGSSGAPRRRLRIIVADDDKDAVRTLAAVLQHEGHEVREVYRGDAVLGMMMAFKPDALLLDIGMPGMSGYEVARKLRERYGDDCPLLIAITGWKKTSERLLGQIVGFHHYVTKPYSADQLLALLAPLTGDEDATLPGAHPEPTAEQRLLAQAAQLMGQAELAAALKVSESVLDSWIDGHAVIPPRQLLTLADVLVTLATRLAKK